MLRLSTALLLTLLTGPATGASEAPVTRESASADRPVAAQDVLRSAFRIRIRSNVKDQGGERPFESWRIGVLLADGVLALDTAGIGSKRDLWVRPNDGRAFRVDRESYDAATGLTLIRVDALAAGAEGPAADRARELGAEALTLADPSVRLETCSVLDLGPEGSGPARLIPWATVGDKGATPADRSRTERIRRTLGGAPVVDPSGQLVGLVRWAEPNRDLGLVAAAALRAAVEGVDWKRPAKHASAGPGAVFPRLAFDAKDDREWIDRANKLAELNESLWCRKCEGSREIEQPNETDGPGGIRNRGVRMVPCPRCDQHGMGDTDDFHRDLRTLSTNAIAAFGTAPTTDRAGFFARAERGVVASALLNRELFKERVRTFARNRLQRGQVQVGRVVVVYVDARVWPTKPTDDWSGDVRVIPPGAHDPILLVDCYPGRNPGKLEDAVVIGAIAGTVEYLGEPHIVLERSMAIALPR